MIKRLILSFVFLASFWATAEAKPPYKVFAYLATTYNGAPSRPQLSVANIPWSDLNSVYVFSASVNTDGSLTYNPSSVYNSLLSTAHTNSSRVYLTVGGDNQAANFVQATNSTNLSNFITNIMNMVLTGDGAGNSYDGVDIDWEFPNENNANPIEETQFMNLMQGLSTQLRAQTAYDGNPMGLDFFSSAGYQNCGVNWATIGNYVDYTILSGYALGVGVGSVTYDGPVSVPGVFLNDCSNHENFQFSISGQAARLASEGFPVNQMILGCPLYGGASGNPDIYRVIQNGSFVSNSTVQMESVYSEYPNNSADDSTAFCEKISWALNQGMPGIALFELSQACPAGDPPVTALWGAITDSSGCVNPPTATNTPTQTNTATATCTNTQCMVGGVPCTSTDTPTATNTATVTYTPTVTPTTVGVTQPIVYPNPTNGQPVSLRLPITSITDVKVEIFTLAFRKVWEMDYSQVNPTTPLLVSLTDKWGATLANGLYYVVAVTSQGTYKTKLLVLR